MWGSAIVSVSHHFNGPLVSLYGCFRDQSQGWRPALEVLAPVVPAQLCSAIDTRSTVLVSGSQSAEHHCYPTKIVPGAGVASGAIFIPSCFCGGLSSVKASISPYECIMIYIWWGFNISNRQQQKAGSGSNEIWHDESEEVVIKCFLPQ